MANLLQVGIEVRGLPQRNIALDALFDHPSVMLGLAWLSRGCIGFAYWKVI